MNIIFDLSTAREERMKNKIVNLEDLIEEKDLEELRSENILNYKNIITTPCLIGVVSALIDRIIQETKDDGTAQDIYLYFSPNNANQGYYYCPFRKMNKFEIII